MKNLQEATERICDLKGSILALDTLVTALAYALPPDVRSELLNRLETHAEVARTVLLQAEISDHTLSAFERDLGRAMNIVRASQRQIPPPTSPPSPQENTMPKGQRSSKEVKKPKKDQSASKPLSPAAVMPTKVTVVPDRSKKK